MEQPKRPRGGQPKPPDQVLIQRSIRLKAEHWKKYDEAGGIEWLRKLIDKARPKG